EKAERVLICQDEAVRTLPFAALVSQTKPQPRYFIEDKPLHTIASTTVYAETRKRASPSNSKLEMKLLAFGDALYTNEQADAAKGRKPGQAARKPGGEGKGAASSNLEVAEAQRRGLKLDRLKETRTEVEEIAKLFGNSATTKLGPDATKTAAQQESPNYTILHFAVHGWFDEQTGLNSGL